MNEALAYESLRPRLQALGLDPHRIENVLAAGTPDVNYVSGWIEMKWLPDWPKRTVTPVTIKSLVERPGQVAFLMRRWAHNGPAWLMLRVDRQLLLFAGPDTRVVRLGRTREELISLACWKTDTHGNGDWQQLRNWLRWRPDDLPAPQRAHLLRLMCHGTTVFAAALLGVSVGEIERAETEECQTTSDLIEAWVV